jgi:hypothetical protein
MREVDEVARQSEVSAAAQREALSAAASEIQAQVTAVLSAAHSSWQSQLNSEVEAAQARWHATLEATLAAAQEKAAAGLDAHVRSLLSQLQDEAGRHTGAVRESMSGAATEAEQRMASLRNSLQEQAQGLEGALGRAAESSDRLEHFSARIETAQGHALACIAMNCIASQKHFSKRSTRGFEARLKRIASSRSRVLTSKLTRWCSRMSPERRKRFIVSRVAGLCWMQR